MSKQKPSKKDATSAFPVVYPLSAGIDIGAAQHYVSVPTRWRLSLVHTLSIFWK